MIDREMDELALLWSEAAALPEEEQIARSVAARVGWRAQMLRYADFVAAVGIAAGVALLVLTEGGGGALGISGLMLVLATGWSTWKRQKLWEIETSAAAGGGAALLASAAASTRARLKRTNFSLLAVPLGVILGLWFGVGLHQPNMESLSELVAYAQAHAGRTVVTVGIVALLLVWLLHSRRSLRRELQRIDALRRDYDDEASYGSPEKPGFSIN